MSRPRVILLFNLLQDVAILRPLAYLAAREFDCRIELMVAAKFLERDATRIWQRELSRIAADVDADVFIHQSLGEAAAIMQGKAGVIFAGSESSLSGHAETHAVFRIAPPSLLKVTLQHGYECVGFLQNREHDAAHGRDVSFAADVLCGWAPAERLTAMRWSERAKLYVTGPTTVLRPDAAEPGTRKTAGLVCENLHSVRLRTTGAYGPSFLATMQGFFEALRVYGAPVHLRPHPGGQYVLKNGVPLPDNVTLSNEPIYRAALASYAFGISAPSSVVIDMVLAGVPVAVWRDAEGQMDAGNYAGLTGISGLANWLAFARDAALRPESTLERQRDFIAGTGLITDTAEITSRFARLIAGALARVTAEAVLRPVAPASDWPHAVKGRLAGATRPLATLTG